MTNLGIGLPVDKQNGMPSNKDVVQELQEILRAWEEDQGVSTNDPTPHLIKLCELFERETTNFLKQDPDPFDDRHPITSKPDCALGQILRVLFKKDVFVTKLVNHYLKENYFSNLGLIQSSAKLNTASCRLLLDLLHGLDIPQVFRDSDSTVLKLFHWAEKADEPLRTYATGLLAAAMDISDLATNFRDQNANLVPIILRRLWELKDEDCNQDDMLEVESSKIPERPFAHLNQDSDIPAVGTSLNDSDIDSDMPLVDSCNLPAIETPVKETIKEDSPAARKTRVNSSSTPCKWKSSSEISVQFGSPKNTCENNLCDNSVMNSDCSNSSWAEMSSYIVGTYVMHPVDKMTKAMFMLKYLRPVGEYQESLGHVYEHHALDLVFHYINVRLTSHARLSFEALRFLGSLLFHKKFCIEFVNMGGVQKLLQVPRPSLPADGVALCLWYLAYCEEAIEKACLLPDNLLNELVRYTLWLLECSHQSSRMHAVMFFGMIFKFRCILEKFDEQDGLRKMLNILSTLSMFQDNLDQETNDEPNDIMMWQTIKQVCLSIKNYFESHLAIRVHQLQRVSSAASSSSSCSSLSSFQHSTPAYKAINITQDSVERNVEYLLEHLPYKGRWKAVEQFLSLKGLQILLRLVATMILNDSFTLSKTETAVSALDSIYICSVMPSVQSALCEKVSVPAGDETSQELHLQQQEVSGFDVLVASIPENNQTLNSSPEVQKAALNVLINALCAPIHRPGSPSFVSSGSKAASNTPGKKKILSSEDVIKKSWDCVRTSNGIMNLLTLLHKKVPITDADCIRSLACRALCGLARSETGRQIMSKLPIFTSGQLQLLMKEPILQDKRIEHIKFQRHALELIKAVSCRSKTQENSTSTDVSVQSIHKANVVAQTRINYNRKQLLQLIHNYLTKEGYEDSAAQLLKEATLPALPTSMGPPSRSNLNTPPPSLIRSRYLSNGTPNVRCPQSTSRIANSIDANNTAHSSVNSGPSSVGSTNLGTTSCPIHIKVNRANKKVVSVVPASTSPLCDSSQSNFSKPEKSLATIPSTAASTSSYLSDPCITLDRIVVEYLTNQHALCEHPVVTCPTFDLFQPHRCPNSKSVRAPPVNFAMRYSKQPYQVPSIGTRVRAANRKFVYSRFRSSHVFRPVDDEVFLTCEFTPDDQYLLVGTTRGEVRMVNKYTDAVIAQETVHQGFVTSLVPHKSGELMLTSCSSSHESALWNIKDLFDNKFTLSDCHHAEFTNAHDKILGTMDETARIYDLNTSKVINLFTPKLSNLYKVNKAALDPSDELLLTDGVLFDVRSGKQVHKFDKINPILNGIFHKNGLEIISSSEIWDLRTFHLLRTVPGLSFCDISFNNVGDVIFGISVGDDDSDENAYETSFKTVDASDYASIATVDVRRIVSSLAINPTDTQIAVVETDGPSDDSVGMESAVVRLYDIGMIRQDDDETLDDDDDDDDMGSDGEESDDSDQDESQNEFGDDDRNSNADDESDVFSIELNSSFMDDDDGSDQSSNSEEAENSEEAIDEADT